MFQGLTEVELGLVESALKEKSFRKGELLFHSGRPCEKIFVVREGRVKVYRSTSTGREQILETLASGDTCACNPGLGVWACTATAEAMTSCRVWFVLREDFARLVQSSSRLSQALSQLFAERLRTYSSLIEEVALKDVKKRLVKFLLEIHAERQTKFGKGDSVFIPFTREEIAQRIGAVRETVVRHLMKLKRARLIDIKPYQIVILNRARLEKML